MVSDQTLQTGQRRISVPGFSRSGPLIISRGVDTLSIWVYSTTDHKYTFEVGRDGDVIFPRRMVQQGESYRSFDLPDYIKAIIEKLGYEVREQ
jgi:hypothetical protein